MRSLIAAIPVVAVLALTGPAQAQMMQPQPAYVSGGADWMQDDGSSSDYPTPMPGDISGERLNQQYRDGIDVPPPHGLPAPYYAPIR